MFVDYGKRKIMVKLVYWGGAMSGKTTSVKYLFNQYDRGDMLQSIETSTGRTLFFDFGELIFNRGQWEFLVNIWTATGQDFYCETRPTVLTGVDGIIFVGDSNPELLKDNQRSWLELVSMLGVKINAIPILFCLNKRDINNRISVDDFRSSLNLGEEYNVIETVATYGQNILESFQKIIKHVFNKN